MSAVSPMRNRLVLVVLWSGLLIIGASLPALAHARLTSTDPADGALLTEAPSSITLGFNEIVQPVSGAFVLHGPDGTPIEGSVRSVNTEVVFEPAQTLPMGTSTLTWRVTSEDGHVITGTLVFHVGEVTGPTGPSDPSGQNPGVIAANALMYIGLLVGAGVALFLVFIHDGGPGWQTLHRLSIGLLTAGLLGVVLFLFAKTVAAAGRFDIAATPTGATLTLPAGIAGVAFAIVGLGRRDRALASFGVGLAMLSLVFIGHTRSVGPTWLVAGADLIHVTAGAIWAGGLTALTIVIRQRRPEAPTRMIQRFSRLAGYTLAAVLVSGVILSFRILGDVEAMLGTNHGRIVLAKLGIVLIVGVIGAINRYRIIPRLTASAKALGQLGTTTMVEVAGVGLVLLLAAALVEQDPHALNATEPVSSSGPTQTVFGEYTLSLHVEPGTSGTNRAVITVRDANTRDIDLPSPPRIALRGPDGEATTHDTEPADEGYVATLQVTEPGVWSIDASARTGTFHESTAGFRLDTSTGALSPRSTLAATDVRMAAPLAGATNTVIYMTLWSGQSANVVFASSPACEEVSLHETVLAADGTTTMRPVTSITLQPNTPVALTSGSIHLMCGNPDPSIAVGDLIPLRLATPDGRFLDLAVSVVSYADLVE